MVGEKVYTVRMVKTFMDVDPLSGRTTRKLVERTVKVSANKISEDENNIIFYDQWGDCAGCFKKDVVISFAREVGGND